MDGDTIRGPATLSGGMLDALMPMHVVLDAGGVVQSHGPTLARLFPGRPLVGQGLFDLFDLRSPRLADGPGRLAGMAGQKLRLVVRGDDAGLRLRGLLVPWPRDDATGRGGDARPCWIANLSFGIDLPRAVSLLHLTDQDFAATDLAMELLYLAEANVSVTGELRALAVRLDGAHRQAREEAETDTLTGLRNRRAADMTLARLCREGAAFGLMHMDLDYFKAVNDTLGHAAGDHVLLEVASVMKAVSRVGDCLARVGGDEFLFVMPGTPEVPMLRSIADRMIAQLQTPILWQGRECRISASIGYLVVEPGAHPDPVALMAEVDAALYEAKNAGRGRAVQARTVAGRRKPPRGKVPRWTASPAA